MISFNSSNTPANVSCQAFHSSAVDAFADFYSPLHIHLSLAICICGIVLNMINVVVLSRQSIRSSTNLLLASLSFAEGMVMSFYIFYVVSFRLVTRLEEGMTQGWAFALLVIVTAMQFNHSYASWMIVFSAAFRLAFTKAGICANQTCSFQRARMVIIVDIVLSIVLTIPFAIAHHVIPVKSNSTIPSYKLDFVANKALQTMLFLTSAVFVKGLPIALMVTFSAILIHTLQVSRRLHERVKSERCDTKESSKMIYTLKTSHSSPDSSSRNMQQTTNILFGLIILYIVTYLPQVSCTI